MHTDGLPDSTADVVAAAGDLLTSTERRIAQAVLAEPTLLAFGTVSDLAKHVGTSRPTIVRFAVKLGFDGYTELQRHARRSLSHQLSRPSERIRRLGESGAASVQLALEEALAGVFEAVDNDRLEVIGKMIARACAVWIISGETSRAGAHTLVSGLSIVRPGVQLVESHTAGADLAEAGPGDAAIAIDFHRYRSQAVSTARTLKDTGVWVVAITDGPLSPLAAVASIRIDLNIPATGPFDSSVPAVAVAELIVARVAALLHDQATQRIDEVERMWEATGTFVKDPG